MAKFPPHFAQIRQLCNGFRVCWILSHAQRRACGGARTCHSAWSCLQLNARSPARSFGGFRAPIGRIFPKWNLQKNMAHHLHLTFPILASAEIVECMDELAIPVTLADLAKVRARGAAQRERMGAYLGRISKSAVEKGVILSGMERARTPSWASLSRRAEKERKAQGTGMNEDSRKARRSSG